MRIRVHIACDDRTYRDAIARMLDDDDTMEVVDEGLEAEEGGAALEAVQPDVTILAVPPGGDVVRLTRMYRAAAGADTGLVGFCTAASQAEAYRQAGVSRLVRGSDTLDELRRAVTSASKRSPRVPAGE